MTYLQDAHIARRAAKYLLDIQAVRLSPDAPFTWASGIVSPIYCDNRLTLSYPEVRRFICDAFADILRRKYPRADLVAGVATGAIAQGVLVADKAGLPFVYVREKAKEHGRKNQVEGALTPGQKTIVIEDLISTGGSSLRAVQALRDAGADVQALGAIMTYGFKGANDAFAAAGCPFFTLTDYDTVISVAVETGYIRDEQLDMLTAWKAQQGA